MKKQFSVAVIAAQVWFALSASARPVDLELLIAVDASGSVSEAEFALQIGGVAAGFRDPEVQEAIRSGPLQRIAVALMIWADARGRKAVSEWVEIDGPESANAFADLVLTQLQRRKTFLGKSGTGIGAAIGEGLKAMRRNGFEGTRLAIDVSGDGHETPLMFGEGMALPEARKRAAQTEVIVNGLAILADDPTLDIYYRARVATGPGSFVLVADGFEDFERAMRLKLLREIRQLVGAAPLAAAPL